MTIIDTDWAIKSLKEFIYSTDQVAYDNSGNSGVFFTGSHQRLPNAKVSELAYVAEQVLDRVLPEWRHENSDSEKARGKQRWNHLREWAGRGVAALERQEELQNRLGDVAPSVSAGDFHLWIWDGAKSLWQSGHYREAVEAAIRKLNAETQNKLDRRDVSETNLFNQAFGDQAATVGKPRLHRTKDDGSQTFKSVQRGARSFAEGVFAGIRNPLAHEVDQEMPEQQALEYLAALSVLARWVDESTLVKATS